MSGGATLDNQLALARISYFVSSISFQNLYYYEAMIDLISVNCYVLFLHASLPLVLSDSLFNTPVCVFILTSRAHSLCPTIFTCLLNTVFLLLNILWI